MPIGGEEYKAAPDPPVALQDSHINVTLVESRPTVWGLLTATLFLGLASLIRKCLGYSRKSSGLAESLEKW